MYLMVYGVLTNSFYYQNMDWVEKAMLAYENFLPMDDTFAFPPYLQPGLACQGDYDLLGHENEFSQHLVLGRAMYRMGKAGTKFPYDGADIFFVLTHGQYSHVMDCEYRSYYRDCDIALARVSASERTESVMKKRARNPNA